MRALILAAALAAVILLAGSGPSAFGASHPRDVCANTWCTKDKPGTKPCRSFRGHREIARCYIRRAAIHFHQSRSLAYTIAFRESRYRWWATNPSGAAGLYQFMPSTWRRTPYGRRHSAYHPRWAALAAMRMWAQGRIREWSTY